MKNLESLDNLCEISFEIDFDVDPNQECYTRVELLDLLGCNFDDDDCVTISSDDFNLTAEPYCFDTSGEIKITITDRGSVLANPIVNVNFPEIPNDGIDNDRDGLEDCHDPDANCAENTAELCFDGQDNDNDGLADELDPKCIQFLFEDSCENCTDGINNDGDINGAGQELIDVFDPDCWAILINECGYLDNDGNGIPNIVDTESDCNNLTDDDGDGLIDCEDPDCGPCDEKCTNGLDDDGDGLIDEEDEDCAGLLGPSTLVLSLEYQNINCVGNAITIDVVLTNTGDEIAWISEHRWGFVYNGDIIDDATVDYNYDISSTTLRQRYENGTQSHYFENDIPDNWKRFYSKYEEGLGMEPQFSVGANSSFTMATVTLQVADPSVNECLDFIELTTYDHVTFEIINTIGEGYRHANDIDTELDYIFFRAQVGESPFTIENEADIPNHFHEVTLTEFIPEDEESNQICFTNQCEICGNGIDDDNDGIDDCDELECKSDPVLIHVRNEVEELNRVIISSAIFNMTLSDYTICIGDQCRDIATGIIDNVEETNYVITIQNQLGCEVDFEIDNEVCGNGVDDDGDGYVDCEDNRCRPYFISVNVEPEICGDGNGKIIIEASPSPNFTAQNINDLEYDINSSGNTQDNGTFSNLSAGVYTIQVYEDNFRCRIDLSQEITVENSCEILGNNEDDDNDGATDCLDTEHYARIATADWSNSSCESNDAWVRIEAIGDEISYHLSGEYFEIKDIPISYNATNLTGEFFGVPPGVYTVRVTNGVSRCQSTRDLKIVRDCEICDNKLDDDGDGDVDCDDLDCIPVEDLNGDGIPDNIPLDQPTLGVSTKKSLGQCSASTVSLEQFFEFEAFKESSKIFGEPQDPSIAYQCGGMKRYFIAPDGRLIDPDLIKDVVFLDPSSPFYLNLKKVVVGFTIAGKNENDDKHYQAVVRNCPAGLQEFVGYFQYDRNERKFSGFLNTLLGLGTPLIADIFSNNTSGDAIVFEHTGDDCELAYSCVEDWNYLSLPAGINCRTISDLTNLQIEIAEKVNSDNITPQILEVCDQISQNGGDLLLFVNGYRIGNSVSDFNSVELNENELADLLEQSEAVPTEHDAIFFDDPYNYWNNSGKFIDRLNPSKVFFADGHLHINTSNHKTYLGFVKNVFDQQFRNRLNDKPYDPGFKERYNAGFRAGKNLVDLVNLNTDNIVTYTNGTIDQKLDIVAHSMGYAYAVGMINAIKNSDIGLEFDRLYIIAPENAGTNSSREFFGIDVFEEFTEVWQYGSKRDRPYRIKDNQGRIDEDPIKEQDGVAPQRGIPIFRSIGESPTEYGRVFIPESIKKGWLKSHSEGSYEWMFNQELLNIIDRGYVKPK